MFSKMFLRYYYTTKTVLKTRWDFFLENFQDLLKIV